MLPTFQLKKEKGKMRIGVLRTQHGEILTPAFMPVGTYGTVKAIFPKDLSEMGFRLLLANTLHLYLRPGKEIIQSVGNLHRFFGWSHSLLTDSGGFQILSMSRLTSITDEGMKFRSHRDGSLHFLTPEEVVEFQEDIGADIIMPLDHPSPYPSAPAVEKSCMIRTIHWLKRSIRAKKNPFTLLFGIIQGGMDPALRREAAERTVQMSDSLDGFAIGGLSVGEDKEKTWELLATILEVLPPDKPRYLMGMGLPEDMEKAVRMGIDLMDCVLPTRMARNGVAFTSEGKVNLKNSQWKKDPRPLDTHCACYTCQNFSRAYLRHLFLSSEILSPMLLTLHNLTFYSALLKNLQKELSGEAEVFSPDNKNDSLSSKTS
ncbi:MAG: tRNA guanosine(34) transglycosylase Tgt [bacterium JZ-2024 1]